MIGVQTGRIPDRLVPRTRIRCLRLRGVSSPQPQTSGLSVVQHRLQHRNRKVRKARSVLIELQPAHHAMLANVFPYARFRNSQMVREPRLQRRLFASACSGARSEEHTSELQSLAYLVCRLLLEKKKN